MKYDRPVNRTCLQEEVKANLGLSILKQRFLITADYKTHNKLDLVNYCLGMFSYLKKAELLTGHIWKENRTESYKEKSSGIN